MASESSPDPSCNSVTLVTRSCWDLYSDSHPDKQRAIHVLITHVDGAKRRQLAPPPDPTCSYTHDPATLLS